MAFDDILRNSVGECGRYQILVILAINLLVVPDSYDTMETVFTAFKPRFWPAGYNMSSNVSDILDPCDCSTGVNVTHEKEPCDSWEYDTSVVESTLVTQFHLVCDRAWLSSLASSVLFLGFMAVFPWGIVSDRFGRRVVLISALILHIITRFGEMFSPNITCYIIFRFLLGTAHITKYTTVFVLGTELVGPSYRLIVGALPCFSWLLGCFLFELTAYLIRTRFYLELVPTIIMICTGVLLRFIPESPRWLCSQGRYEEAYRILRTMAKTNGRDLPFESQEIFLESITDPKEVKEKTPTTFSALWLIITSRVMMLRTAVLVLTWIWSSLLFYVITINAGRLAGSLHLNTFLTSLVELPAYIAIIVTLSTKSGRAVSISASMILSGIFGLTKACLDAGTAATALSLLGKLCITYAYGAIYVFTAELYPTVVRNLGVGFCSLCSRIGTTLAPVVAVHGAFEVSLGIGVVAVLAGILLLTLPETRWRKLPQTIADAEDMIGLLYGKCIQLCRKNKKPNNDIKTMSA